jgi:hydroxymethylbilane synthase
LKLVLGSRGSPLAMWQARWVQAQLGAAVPPVEIEIRVIHTSGDRIAGPLSASGGKGLFVKEIEEALAKGEIDLAVHSLKDVPAAIAPAFAIAAIPKREDPRDALVSRDRIRFLDLGPGARIGTSSLRRACQLRERRPEIEVVPLRGNVDTRLRKMRSGEVDAVVLALAGLRRLGLDGEVAEVFEIADCLPAVGQGALAIETRAGDERVLKVVAPLDHPPTAAFVRAERAFLSAIGGDCQVPVAAHARGRDGVTVIDGLVGRPDGSEVLRGHAEDADPVTAGTTLARTLLDRGAGRILAAFPR